MSSAQSKPWLHRVTSARIVNESMDSRSRHKYPEVNTRYSQWQYRGDNVHVVSAILPLTIMCIHFRVLWRERLPILVNGTPYSRGTTYVAQAAMSRRQRSSCKLSMTCVRYAYACISRDTAVWLNLAKQHNSACTSFSSILSKML